MPIFTKKYSPPWKTINIAMFFLVALFIIVFFYQQWKSITTGPLIIHYRLLALNIVMIEAYWVYMIFLWARIMRSLDIQTNFKSAGYLYFSSALLSYIPGKVSGLIGVSSISKQLNISTPRTITTTILAQLYSLISGVFIIGLLWWFASPTIYIHIPKFWGATIIVITILSLFCLSSRLINQLIIWANKIFMLSINQVDFPLKKHIEHVLIYSLGWLFLGLIMLLLINTFGNSIPLSAFFNITILFVISYLIRILAFIFPAGLGVFEVGLLFGLSALFNPKQTAFAVIGFRLATLLTLLISYFISYFVIKRRPCEN